MIELTHVSFRYQKESEPERLDGFDVSDVSFSVRPGELVVLCGESGCGKSTVTRLINGLAPHFYKGELEGRVMVAEVDVAKAPLHETALHVGSVFQNPRSQFFNVDTRSEIAFACENQGLPVNVINERVARAAREADIEPLLGKSIFQLSGGQKQRIACASVSAAEPSVIVLDEPSSNLDPEGTIALADMLRRWKAVGKAVVVAEHRVHYLRDLADRYIYMSAGRIEASFDEYEFRSLSLGRRLAMGLRSPDPGVLPIPDRRRSGEEPGGELELRGFRHSFAGGVETLRIDALTLPAGSAIAILGRNGAGKTTLARCLCGLTKRGPIRRRAGSASLDGAAINRRGRSDDGYLVMQDVNHQLFTESALDEVLLSLPGKESEAERLLRAEDILESLDLLPFKDAHPMALSGGQKQRLAIASALASGKRLIVLDEPTSGLDLRHMSEVAERINELKAAGKTVLVITHDLELVLAVCDHVVMLDSGSVTLSEPLGPDIKDSIKNFFKLNQILDHASVAFNPDKTTGMG